MSASVKSLRTIETKCKKCKGMCWDPDQSKRQANARAFFKSALPNACVDSEADGPKCPYMP